MALLSLLFSLAGVRALAQIPGLEVGGSLAFSSHKMIPQEGQAIRSSSIDFAPWICMDVAPGVFAGATFIWRRYKAADSINSDMIGLSPFVGLSLDITPRIKYIPDLYVGSTWGNMEGQKAQSIEAALEFGIIRFNINAHWAVSGCFGALVWSSTRIRHGDKTNQLEWHLFDAPKMSLIYSF